MISEFFLMLVDGNTLALKRFLNLLFYEAKVMAARKVSERISLKRELEPNSSII